LEEHSTVDLTIDGADQIDDQMNLIKGMGGALAREKIVASASKNLAIIADESKKVNTLGENSHPVPIEVLPFATAFVSRRIEESGGRSILREGKGKVGPIVTDNGNVILDAVFGLLHSPEKLERELRSIPGVVETGLFVGMADVVYVGKRSGVERLAGKA
jgi:ribose 5-phosphate isomerase A